VEVDSSLKGTGEAAESMENASGELDKVSAKLESIVAEYKLEGENSLRKLPS